MKNLKRLLFVAAMAVVLVGCRKPVEVSFGSATQEIDPQGATVEVALVSNGDWTIASTSEWITVSPTSGNGNANLTLTVQPNTSSAVRSAEIKATTKDNAATLTVTQDYLTYYLTATPNQIECEQYGGEFPIEVQSNLEWSLSGLPDWITASATSGVNNGSINLTVAAIEDEIAEPREAVLSISGETVIVPIVVRQTVTSSYNFFVNPNKLDFDYVGGTETLTVSSNVSWSASVNVGWITLAPASGDSNAEVTVNVAENEISESRDATIRFDYTFPSGASGAFFVMVNQEAAPNSHFLTVTPMQLEFEAEGGMAEITVECDTDWEIDFESEWVSTSVYQGSENGTFTITVANNEMPVERDMEVPVVSGELKRVISIHQWSNVLPEFSFSTDTVFLSPEGDVETVYITSNVAWQLMAPSWVTLIPTSGNGDGNTSIIIDKNPTSEARIGVINAFSQGQNVGRVVMYQAGRVPILEVDVLEIQAPAEGGAYVINVTSNQSWTVSKGAYWLNYTPTSGLGNGSIEVNVDALESLRPRTAEIYLTGSEGGHVIISVEQQP